MIQVQKASDPTAAAEALDRARMDIMALDGGWTSAPNLRPGITNGPKYVGEVLPAGTGPAVAVDGGYTPLKLLLTIPDLVAARLADAGVTDAVVASPDEGGTLVGGLDRLTRAVVLHLYPPAALDLHEITPVPEPLLEAADRWLRSGLVDGDHLWAAVEVLEFPLIVGAARTLLEQCNRFAPASCWLVAGRPPTPPPAKARRFTSEEWVYVDMLNRIGGRVRAVQWSSGHLALAGGGPDVSDDGLIHIMEQLVEVARVLAPHLSYAAISFEAHFGSLAMPGSIWSADAGRVLLDIAVADAFPYQILCSGHLQRLGAVPEGATELDGGRVELRIGEGATWLPIPQQERWGLPQPCLARRGGRNVLAECLLTSLEADRIARRRQFAAGIYRECRRYPTFPQARAALEHVGGELDALDAVRQAVVLRLYLSRSAASYPHNDVPRLWVEEAAAWMCTTYNGDDELCVAVERNLQFRIAQNDAKRFLALSSMHSASSGAIVAGDLMERVCGVNICCRNWPTDRWWPSLTLAVGGSARSEGDLFASYEVLRDLSRRLSSTVDYAVISIEDDWGLFWRPSEELDHPPSRSESTLDGLLGGFPYQVLGPGHRARLQEWPAGVVDLGNGRAELSIGDPPRWLASDTDRSALHAEARGRLANVFPALDL